MSLVAQYLNHPLAWLQGNPTSEARLRSCAEDFQVVERLGFVPDGEGEHLFLRVRKCGENTDWVARQIAHFCRINPRLVSYAGKKDRHAVTEQWFCLPWPIKQPHPHWASFNSDTIQVLEETRHGRKLKLGVAAGNHFRIRLRQVTELPQLKQRLQTLHLGVPNYFGEQRFGQDHGNLLAAEGLLFNGRRERQAHKRGLYISAVRSALFNRVLSERLQQGLWTRLLDGDVLMLNGSQSCFRVKSDEHEAVAERLQTGDLHLTGPMWGAGELMTQNEAADFEHAAVAPLFDWAEALAGLGLRQERRALRLVPEALEWTEEADDQISLAFALPSGAFATSVLRELCHWQTGTSSGSD